MNQWSHPLFFAVLLATPLAQAGESLFRDDFDGKLGDGWSWVRENRDAWRVVDRALEIRIEPGNLWGPANNAKNVLTRPAPDPGKTGLDISVTVSNRPSAQYEQANLAWYYDDSHMVKLGQEMVDGKVCIVMGREENDRARTLAIIPCDAARVQLRFNVTAGKIRGYYRVSTDEPWRDVGECDLSVHGEPKISLHAYQGPADEAHWARFSDIRVTRAKR